MANGRLNQPGVDEANITTVLAEDVSVKGMIQFKSSAMIKGAFEGEIQSDGMLVVGPTATVNAKIGTKILISYGQIAGDATVSEQVVLMSTALYKGNITTPNIVIESGSKFNGSCTMTSQE